jgi:hypothetical protein
MIVERWTWTVRPRYQSEVIELLKALVEALGFTPRICTYRFGATDRVSSELESESYQARAEWWDGFDGNVPEYVAWLEKQSDLTEAGRTCELLIVH